MNPIHYRTTQNEMYNKYFADESDSEASDDQFKDVEIYETKYVSDEEEPLPNPPPNSPTEPVSIPEKKKPDVENWNIVFFGD